MQRYRSLNIQNTAKSQLQVAVIQFPARETELANLRNNLICQPLMYAAFRLKKTKGFL